MALANACVFCRIAAHEQSEKIWFEDDDLVAFDAKPKATPVHVLVVPRRHVASLSDLDDDMLAGRLVRAATRVAREAGLTGYRVATNSGPPWQYVLHLHWHVMGGGPMGHAAGIAFSRGRVITRAGPYEVARTQGDA
jgi:histidine triad (HIT) family protein